MGYALAPVASSAPQPNATPAQKTGTTPREIATMRYHTPDGQREKVAKKLPVLGPLRMSSPGCSLALSYLKLLCLFFFA